LKNHSGFNEAPYLLKLPPYAPELNPIEHVWDELREKFFHNRVFKSLDALEDHLTEALKSMEENARVPGTDDGVGPRRKL
jgi:transposase